MREPITTHAPAWKREPCTVNAVPPLHPPLGGVTFVTIRIERRDLETRGEDARLARGSFGGQVDVSGRQIRAERSPEDTCVVLHTRGAIVIVGSLAVSVEPGNQSGAAQRDARRTSVAATHGEIVAVAAEPDQHVVLDREIADDDRFAVADR
jgi:hypothetical protein